MYKRVPLAYKSPLHHQKNDFDEVSRISIIISFINKMSNPVSAVANALRNVVSKKRIRYKEKGFNLDLAYICDNIIAMGYPADSLEGIYRNHIEDVVKFLEEEHKDHYKIYNLRSERSYDVNKFHGRVKVYPFEDHNPPTIELIQNFCIDVSTWLKADTQNVAAVHCKAGKGRTGTMICCYLLYSGLQDTADDALAYYDEKRTKNRKGVTIPSQRRYVHYFDKLLQSGVQYEKRTLQFCEIRFSDANLLQNQGTVHCSISVLQDTSSVVKEQTLRNLPIDFRKNTTLDITPLSAAGDIKVELTHKTARKKIFHFWFNTFFIRDLATTEVDGDDAKLVYTLTKNEIDDAHKDKEHKCFSEDFKVHLVFYAESSVKKPQTNENNWMNNHRTSQSANLTQESYLLPQNCSSSSDLNLKCDQKSSSTASICSLSGGGGGDCSSTDTKKSMRTTMVENTQPSCMTLQHDVPPLYSRYGGESGVDSRQQQYPKAKHNFHQNQHQVVQPLVTSVTSTPKQNHYIVDQSQQQQPPSSNAAKVNQSAYKNYSKDTKQQCSALSNPNHAAANSSKSSSFSSHSSSSATGDNEEDWESGESHAKPTPNNTLRLSSPIPPPNATYSPYIPASKPYTNSFLSFHNKSSSCCKKKFGGDIKDDDFDDVEDVEDVDDDGKLKKVEQNNIAIDMQQSPTAHVTSIDNSFSIKNSFSEGGQQLSLLQAINTSSTRSKIMHLLSPKTNESQQQQQHKPFFRRKSFKSATVSSSSSLFAQHNLEMNKSAGCSTANNGGILATSSKQKLKTKFKKNKLKLSQKFQWFQNYIRSDPDDFCENFVQQTTAMRRNSTCSMISRSRKLSATAPAAPPTSVRGKISDDNMCDDIYSSFCDNQLSFNNSPCKSPRSITNDALRGDGVNENTFASNATAVEHKMNATTKQSELSDEKRNVVIVAAKPAKTHAIGFNVNSPIAIDRSTVRKDACDGNASKETLCLVIRKTEPTKLLSNASETKECAEIETEMTQLKLETGNNSQVIATITDSNSTSSGCGTSSECCTNSSESYCSCSNPFIMELQRHNVDAMAQRRTSTTILNEEKPLALPKTEQDK